MARAGRDVLVLEAHSAGAGATGNTTARSACCRAPRCRRSSASTDRKIAEQYVQGNCEGQEWLVRHCEAHGISVQREDAYTYAQSDKGRRITSRRRTIRRTALRACDPAG